MSSPHKEFIFTGFRATRGGPVVRDYLDNPVFDLFYDDFVEELQDEGEDVPDLSVIIQAWFDEVGHFEPYEAPGYTVGSKVVRRGDYTSPVKGGRSYYLHERHFVPAEKSGSLQDFL